MTNRVNKIVVVLEQDMRDDDVENLVELIKLLRGVLSASAVGVDEQDFVAKTRVILSVREKVLELLDSI